MRRIRGRTSRPREHRPSHWSPVNPLSLPSSCWFKGVRRGDIAGAACRIGRGCGTGWINQSLVGDARVRSGDVGAYRGAAALARPAAPRRPSGASRAVSNPAGSRLVSRAAALFLVPLVPDRQSRSGLAAAPARAACWPRARGEADHPVHPRPDITRHVLGRARGSRPHSADGIVRASAHLQPAVQLRLPQLLLGYGACAHRLRALAAAHSLQCISDPSRCLRPSLRAAVAGPCLRMGRVRTHGVRDRVRPVPRAGPDLARFGIARLRPGVGPCPAGSAHPDLALRGGRRQ